MAMLQDIASVYISYILIQSCNVLYIIAAVSMYTCIYIYNIP